jgi:hypothetical protein
VLNWALGQQLFAVHVSPQVLGAHTGEIAHVARLDLPHVKALESPAQFLGTYRSTRLSSLIGFIRQLAQHLHVRVEG